MDYRKKLEKLVGGKNKSDICRSVDLPISSLDAMVNKGRMPRAVKAVKIARALGVSCDWLFDDEQGWPPPKAMPPTELTDYDLVEMIKARIATVTSHVGVVGERLSEARLQQLNELAAKHELSHSERTELRQGLRDIAYYENVSRRRNLLMVSIEWLDSDDHSSPDLTFADLDSPKYRSLIEAYQKDDSLNHITKTRPGWARPPQKAFDRDEEEEDTF